MTASQRRVLFYSAAVFNWAACVMFFPMSGISAAVGFTPLMTHGPFDQIALLAIALLGYGYWMVAGNPAAHRGIIVLGIIGKLGVFAIMFGHYFLVGDVNLAQALVTLGDVIYAALFFHVLRTSGELSPATEKS